MTAAARGGEALESRAGAVRVAGRAGLKAPAPVAVLGPAQPLRGPPNRRGRGTRSAQREDPERGQVHLPPERATTRPLAAQLGWEVTPGEAMRIDAGALKRQDRALEVAGGSHVPGLVAQVGDRCAPAAPRRKRA